MNGTVFRCHEVVVTGVIDWEINRETTRVDEYHAAGLLLADGACIHVLLVRICLSLQLLKVAVLEALFHRPFNNPAITRDRDERLSLVLALNPLDFPDDVCVLVRDVL